MQKKLIEELRAANGGSDTGLTQEECSHFGTRGNVTTAIVTHVKPGKELEYRQWEEKIQVAQTASAGYQGSFLQPPTGGDTGMWVTLLRFDAPESLERWFKSAARSQLLNEAEQLVQSTDIRKVTSSFPGWVPVDDKGNGPPNWKTFLLVLLGLYPIVTLEIRFLMSHLAFLPHPVANLIGNAISVALTTWVTMPLFIKWFGPWLFAPKESASSDQMKWIAIVIASFAAALACMWNVL
jgi:hypothetical protein